MTRREFLTQAAASALVMADVSRTGAANAEPFVQTVLGPHPVSRLGFALPHEHVMCDFIGAQETSAARWNVAAVVQRMRPFLADLRRRGIDSFFDCTPAYIGREPRVLKALAEETGLLIVTNTGYYGGAGDKFVPKHAYAESAEQLATRWVREWESGIDGTGIKPGFIKTGVDEVDGTTGRLSDIDAKLVRAAAKASKTSGLAVTCHTGGGPAGLAAVRLFIEEGAPPDRLIIAHSDGHGLDINRKVAELGAWVSFDAISRKPLEEHLRLVGAMIETHPGRLLLSHDNGWYWVGQDNGGEVRDFNYLADVFLPALRKSHPDRDDASRLTVENPSRAFRIQSHPAA